jgi:hypothetical protein
MISHECSNVFPDPANGNRDHSGRACAPAWERREASSDGKNVRGGVQARLRSSESPSDLESVARSANFNRSPARTQVEVGRSHAGADRACMLAPRRHLDGSCSLYPHGENLTENRHESLT